MDKNEREEFIKSYIINYCSFKAAMNKTEESDVPTAFKLANEVWCQYNKMIYGYDPDEHIGNW